MIFYGLKTKITDDHQETNGPIIPPKSVKLAAMDQETDN